MVAGEETLEELRAAVVELRDALGVRDERIAELERLLGEARRSGKRQAAPFSKGLACADPKVPGRKSGKGHVVTGIAACRSVGIVSSTRPPRRCARIVAGRRCSSGSRINSRPSCPTRAR